MSVPESERSKGKLEAIVQALNLCVHTLQICKNQKVFLPEYNTAITNDIIHTATAIYMDCWTANNIMVRGDAEKAAERKRLQTRAILNCNNLLGLMQIAQKLFHIDGKRIKYWGQMTIDTRNLIRGWRESDSKRYGV